MTVEEFGAALSEAHHLAVRTFSVTADNNFTPEDIVFAIFCMISGLFLVFIGYRLLMIALFLTGTYLGYVIMYAILTSAGVEDDLVVVFVSLGVGLVVGVLTLALFRCLMSVCLFLLGFLVGFVFAIWIQSWAEGGLIENDAWKWVFIVVCALIVGLLTSAFQKLFIIIGTSFYGSYFVFYGIDVFVQTGYSQNMETILSGKNDAPQEFGKEIYGMLIGTVLLAIVGVFVQIKYTASKYNHKEHYGNHEYENI